MDRLGELEAFVAVVETGGFTEAAKRQNLSKSAISKQISALEDRLAARLLDRTTRSVAPTDIGRAFYERAVSIMAAVGEAEGFVDQMQNVPRGTLKISAAVDFGAKIMPDIVARFLAEYPDVEIEMVLSNAYVDLMSDGYDLAIRVGRLADSSLKARKLGTARLGLVASPDYLARAGTPETVTDLDAHVLLKMMNESGHHPWTFANGAEASGVQRLAVNEGMTLMKSAELGMGLARLPSFMYASSVSEGRLERIKLDVADPLMDIHAVFRPGQYVQPKLRVFLDHLATELKGRQDEDW